MSTINQIADALEVLVKAAVPSIRFYSEGEERPEADSAVVLFRGQRTAQDCGSQVTMLSIEVSVPVGDRGMPRAYRMLRDYISHEGSLSLVAPIEADRTLGAIAGCTASVKTSEIERIKGFVDGQRVAGFIQLEILHD